MNVVPTLYEPTRHCVSAGGLWSEQQAQATIQTIISGVCAAQQREGCWPNDLSEFPLSLYDGVAGIAWALDELRQRGYCTGQQSGLCATAAASFDQLPVDTALFEQFQVPVSQSFYLGASGVLLQIWKETGEASILNKLDALIAENQTHPWLENLWGAPSTMLVASHLYKATGEERFAEHIRSGAAYIEQKLQIHPDADCQMWNIDLYGERTWLLGAGHGFVGNVFPILTSASIFDERTITRWRERIVDTAIRTAERENGMANWRQSIGNIRKGRDSMLVQQCHGAPGFIISLASLIGTGHTEFDALMLEAGELVWAAGPLNKYPGLCHGTPGNGYALLKLYEKTGDALWLQRARVFAMSSVEQHQQLSVSDSGPSYSLWGGDMGLAMYLADCIDARCDFPTLDYF
ncbi:MAG: lantibiotic modifying enzyme [Halioglobus sp.]|jgi:lantibiotic modifying enzyme